MPRVLHQLVACTRQSHEIGAGDIQQVAWLHQDIRDVEVHVRSVSRMMIQDLRDPVARLAIGSELLDLLHTARDRQEEEVVVAGQARSTAQTPERASVLGRGQGTAAPFDEYTEEDASYTLVAPEHHRGAHPPP